MKEGTAPISAPPRGPTEVAPGVRRLIAPNPSPMTYWGTNTYLLGTATHKHAEVAVVDPGPASAAHIEAILAAVGPARLTHILVTHAHVDHSPGARLLAERTGAPILAFGGPRAGRSPRMAALQNLGGGEGVDVDFVPDQTLADGERVTLAGTEVEGLWTPGHFGNHLSFALPGGVMLTGDLVMGWASSLVSPPDGDLGDFMASLARLEQRDDRLYLPGHGAPFEHPQKRVAELAAHRRARHVQILSALSERPGTAAQLAARIYTETPAALLRAASRNVLAHLVEMTAKNEARPVGPLHADAPFEPI